MEWSLSEQEVVRASAELPSLLNVRFPRIQGAQAAAVSKRLRAASQRPAPLEAISCSRLPCVQSLQPFGVQEGDSGGPQTIPERCTLL